MAASVAEHKKLLEESGAMKYFRETGWMTLYRSDAAFEAMKPQLEFGAQIGVAAQTLDTEGALALEPSLAPVFRHALMWPDVASLSNPLMVTRAYAARFSALGGVFINGDARSLHRADGHWRVDTNEGHVDAENAVVALGPWAPDVLEPLGIKVPLGIKRGYHRHYDPKGNASLSRPIIDTEYGYALTPMEQGIRLTTGAEFADRDARADAGAVRPRAAGRQGAVSARRAEREPSRGSAAGRTCRIRFPCSAARPGQAGPVARLRAWALGPDAGRGDGAADRRDDDGRDAARPIRRRIGPERFRLMSPWNLSFQLGSAPGKGSAVASYTARATARASTFAATAPSSASA